MNELFEGSAFFGAAISIVAYEAGILLKKKFNMAIFNPLLVAIVIVIVFLVFFDIDYENYYSGAKYISFLLTPATVCLAVPLYDKIVLLKKNFAAIAGGITSGVITSLGSVLVMSAALGLNHAQYVTMLPKSITMAIGIGVSEELGGIVTITSAVIIITGVLGNMTAEAVCKIFGIKDPVAVGIAIGSASHAIGTAKAMEIGETQGAMSSLSIAVAGLLTVAGASVFAGFY